MSYERLTSNWVYGGFLSAFVITALGLVLLRDASLALVLVYLHLPMYQVHQYEEHDGDRFRTWGNDVMGGGRDLLPVTAIFVINIVGVWALFTAVIVGAASYDIGLGLAVVYPTLINAVAHVVPVLVSRKNNPGAGTAARSSMSFCHVRSSVVACFPTPWASRGCGAAGVRFTTRRETPALRGRGP